MRRHAWIVPVIFVLLCGWMWPACDDDDDDGNQVAPTPPPGSCTDNTAPQLSAAALFVDGEQIAAGGQFMEATPVDVYLSYQDAECNLGGGRIYFSYDGAEAEDAGFAAANAPCSATAQEQQVGFSFVPMGEGDHQLSVYVEDLCGEAGNTVTVAFSLTPWVGGDDDTGDDDTTVEPTLLTGEIRYSGADDYTDRPMYLFLYTEWLPTSLVPAAIMHLNVPAEGFPFDYEWDLGEAAVDDGSYYLAAFMDVEDGDGFFNYEVDPVHSPYTITEVISGQTTNANVTLVDPAK